MCSDRRQWWFPFSLWKTKEDRGVVESGNVPRESEEEEEEEVSVYSEVPEVQESETSSVVQSVLSPPEDSKADFEKVVRVSRHAVDNGGPLLPPRYAELYRAIVGSAGSYNNPVQSEALESSTESWEDCLDKDHPKVKVQEFQKAPGVLEDTRKDDPEIKVRDSSLVEQGRSAEDGQFQKAPEGPSVVLKAEEKDRPKVKEQDSRLVGQRGSEGVQSCKETLGGSNVILEEARKPQKDHTKVSVEDSVVDQTRAVEGVQSCKESAGRTESAEEQKVGTSGGRSTSAPSNTPNSPLSCKKSTQSVESSNVILEKEKFVIQNSARVESDDQNIVDRRSVEGVESVTKTSDGSSNVILEDVKEKAQPKVKVQDPYVVEPGRGAGGGQFQKAPEGSSFIQKDCKEKVRPKDSAEVEVDFENIITSLVDQGRGVKGVQSCTRNPGGSNVSLDGAWNPQKDNPNAKTQNPADVECDNQSIITTAVDQGGSVKSVITQTPGGSNVILEEAGSADSKEEQRKLNTTVARTASPTQSADSSQSFEKVCTQSSPEVIQQKGINTEEYKVGTTGENTTSLSETSDNPQSLKECTQGSEGSNVILPESKSADFGNALSSKEEQKVSTTVGSNIALSKSVDFPQSFMKCTQSNESTNLVLQEIKSGDSGNAASEEEHKVGTTGQDVNLSSGHPKKTNVGHEGSSSNSKASPKPIVANERTSMDSAKESILFGGYNIALAAVGLDAVPKEAGVSSPESTTSDDGEKRDSVLFEGYNDALRAVALEDRSESPDSWEDCDEESRTILEEVGRPQRGSILFEG
jgi:hypothetical protein